MRGRNAAPGCSLRFSCCDGSPSRSGSRSEKRTSAASSRPGSLSILIGTITFSLGADWSVVDGLYVAVATRTTSSILDPKLTVTDPWLKIFTAGYVLVGIGILVEVARRLGMGFIAARAEVREAQVAAAVEADPRPPSDGAA